jgi:hypothetical protein
MKVWIVVYRDFDYTRIRAVCSTEEIAREFVDNRVKFVRSDVGEYAARDEAENLTIEAFSVTTSANPASGEPSA